MSRAVWTTLAKADLERIDEQYAEVDADYADRVGRAAIRASGFLADFPYAGEEVAPDHRRWRVPATPYVLIYRVAENVEILRVRHDRENWRSELP